LKGKKNKLSIEISIMLVIATLTIDYYNSHIAAQILSVSPGIQLKCVSKRKLVTIIVQKKCEKLNENK